MRAAILSVGSEILRGTLLDTNSRHFARELSALGVPVSQICQVGDERDVISRTIQALAGVADLIVVCGGLGPTEDDLTREALIDLTGESPTIDQDILSTIRDRFRMRGSDMPARNEKQAWRIPSARVIPNDHGSAPGWLVEHGETTIIVLPGPPRENQPMWLEHVRPALITRISNHAIISRTVKTIGVGESAVADRIADFIAIGWPQVATYAKADGVHVTITAAHEDRGIADQAVRVSEREIVGLLEPNVYGRGDESLASAIVQPLISAGVQIVVREIGSAGSLSSMLLGDIVARAAVADAVCTSWEHAVRARQSSIDAVTLAAEAASHAAGQTTHGTVIGLAVKIDGDEAGVQDGTAGIALIHAGGSRKAQHRLSGLPEEIRRRAALHAAELLWFELRSAAGIHPAVAASSPSSRASESDPSQPDA